MRRMFPLILAAAMSSVAYAAAAQDFTLGGRVGVSRTPLADFSGFASSYSGHSLVTRDHLGITWGLRAGWLFADHHALRFELSRMVNSARATNTGSFDNLELTNAMATVSYQYLLKGRRATATPFLGVGPIIVRSELGSTGFSSGYSTATAALSQLPRHTWLPGIAAHLGERAAISRSLSMSAELMAAWTQRENLAIGATVLPVEFTGFSLSLGLDWVF